MNIFPSFLLKKIRFSIISQLNDIHVPGDHKTYVITGSMRTERTRYSATEATVRDVAAFLAPVVMVTRISKPDINTLTVGLYV